MANTGTLHVPLYQSVYSDSKSLRQSFGGHQFGWSAYLVLRLRLLFVHFCVFLLLKTGYEIFTRRVFLVFYVLLFARC